MDITGRGRRWKLNHANITENEELVAYKSGAPNVATLYEQLKNKRTIQNLYLTIDCGVDAKNSISDSLPFLILWMGVNEVPLVPTGRLTLGVGSFGDESMVGVPLGE